jgi:hypothetical protein
MMRYIWLFVFLFGLTACALPVRTHGIAGPVSWSTTDFELSSAGPIGGITNRFAFTLTLQETQGVPLTFTAITWEVWQKGVDLSEHHRRTGAWPLPAHGTLRQPVVYRIYCPPSDFCPDLGPTTQWDMALEGHDAQGQPVRLALQPELPWIPPKLTAPTSPDAPPHPSIELPLIDIKSRRLYYPLVSR